MNSGRQWAEGFGANGGPQKLKCYEVGGGITDLVDLPMLPKEWHESLQIGIFLSFYNVQNIHLVEYS